MYGPHKLSSGPLRVNQGLRVEASFSCLYGWGSGLAFRISEWGLLVLGFPG